MEEYNKLIDLRAKFAAALANPLPGKRPILKLIKPHFKRPPFNRTHRILRRRHRKKDPNPDHYNVPVGSYYALRWVKADKPVDPEPGIIVAPEQLEVPPVLPEENNYIEPPPPPPSPAPAPEVYIDLPIAPEIILKPQSPPRSPTPEEIPLEENDEPWYSFSEGDDDDDAESEASEEEEFAEKDFPEQEGEVLFSGNSQSLPPQGSLPILDEPFPLPAEPYNPFTNPRFRAIQRAKIEKHKYEKEMKQRKEKAERYQTELTQKDINNIQFIDRRKLIDAMPTKLYFQDISAFVPDAKKPFTDTDAAYKIEEKHLIGSNDDDLAPPKKRKN